MWIYCHSFKETPQFKTKPKNFQRFLANLYVEATDPDKSNSTQVIVNGTTNTNTVNNNSSLNNTGNINNSSNKPIDINPTPIYERILKANILLLLFITLLLF